MPTSRREWTEEEHQRALDMIRAGMSYQKIGHALNRSYSDVQIRFHAALGCRKKQYIWIAYDKNGEWIAAALTADDLGEILMQQPETMRQRAARWKIGQSPVCICKKIKRGDEEVSDLVGSGTD